jgi:hydrogenase maturation protease
MASPRILIACVGNIFLGDDGFGVEAARRLLLRNWPEGVRIVDFGIRGFDLTFALLEGYDAIIFVDAIQCGGAPGALYLVEPDLCDPGLSDAGSPGIEPHGMDPVKVLRTAQSMGAQLGRVFLVGCEPETFGPEEGQMGLSASVAAALDEAVEMTESLVGSLPANLGTPRERAEKLRNKLNKRKLRN